MNERLRRRRLPHLDVPGASYFVTVCLADSIPAQGLLEVEEYTATLQAQRPRNVSVSEWNTRCWKLAFAKREQWLDEHPAARLLEDERLATLVEQSLLHFAGSRYKLWAYVVMPSHYHVAFEPDAESSKSLPVGRSPREVIMHSIDRHSALECNRILGKTGKFWQHEPYDHVIRDEAELEPIVQYIENNPVKAGLCSRPEAWRWSSAYRRLRGASF